MKKDTVYTFRMRWEVKEAIQRAARKDHRSVASLLDKIISDYLEKEGLPATIAFDRERRRFFRNSISFPIVATVNAPNEKELYAGMTKNVSTEGALVEFPANAGIPIKLSNPDSLLRLCLDPESKRNDSWFDFDAKHMAYDGKNIRIGGMFRNLSSSQANKLNQHLS